MNDPIRCRYGDCAAGHPEAAEDESVTCAACREWLGLPPLPSPLLNPDDWNEIDPGFRVKCDDGKPIRVMDECKIICEHDYRALIEQHFGDSYRIGAWGEDADGCCTAPVYRSENFDE